MTTSSSIPTSTTTTTSGRRRGRGGRRGRGRRPRLHRTRRKRRYEDEDEDDDELIADDDVEADLDKILKDRMVTVDEDDEDEEEDDETDVPGGGRNGCCPSSRTSSCARRASCSSGRVRRAARRRRRLSHLLLRTSDRPRGSSIRSPGLARRAQLSARSSGRDFVGKSAVDRAIGQRDDRLAGEPRRIPFPSSRRSPVDGGGTTPSPAGPDADGRRSMHRGGTQLACHDYDTCRRHTSSAKLASLTPEERATIERLRTPTAPSHDPRQDRPAARRRDGAMIDPTVRRCRADDADVEQLELLEREARAGARRRARGRAVARRASSGRRPGGANAARRRDVWIVPHRRRGRGLHGGSGSGADMIVRIDQVWVTPLARESASAMRCSSRPSARPASGERSPWRANPSPGTARRRTSTNGPGSSRG